MWGGEGSLAILAIASQAPGRQPQVEKLLRRPSLLVQERLLSVKGESIPQAVPEEVTPKEDRALVRWVSREVG